MKILGVIPARYHSTRLPQKVLRTIGDKTLVQHVWDQCKKATRLSDLIIATDHEDIMVAITTFGGKGMMTDPNHQSGTDRVVEVATAIDCDVVINIQGDEPFIDPAAIDALAAVFEHDEDVNVATLCYRVTDEAVLNDPNVVKVVRDQNDYALYFSRAPIPFDREQSGTGACFKHIGIYAFRKSFLMQYSSLPASMLEQTEKLEQLRILEAGERIKAVETTYNSQGIDTEEDLKEAERIYQGKNRK